MNSATEPGTVGALMTGDPIVATIDTPLHEAAAIMDFYRVSALPIVDWTGCLVGVISQTDLLHARTTQALWHAWPGLTVRHLMTRPAIAVTAETALDEAAELMESRRVHRLVVVARDGETPIGVLSVTDLVHAMVDRGEA
jgi:CBS domain-containing protein